jgi:hypothetical protein
MCLPKELEDEVDMKHGDYMKIVEEYFMKNQVAADNAKKFIENHKKRTKPGLASVSKTK